MDPFNVKTNPEKIIGNLQGSKNKVLVEQGVQAKKNIQPTQTPMKSDRQINNQSSIKGGGPILDKKTSQNRSSNKISDNINLKINPLVEGDHHNETNKNQSFIKEGKSDSKSIKNTLRFQKPEERLAFTKSLEANFFKNENKTENKSNILELIKSNVLDNIESKEKEVTQKKVFHPEKNSSQDRISKLREKMLNLVNMMRNKEVNSETPLEEVSSTSDLLDKWTKNPKGFKKVLDSLVDDTGKQFDKIQSFLKNFSPRFKVI
jgi:hypothetical protein